jgi:hypothetical protein
MAQMENAAFDRHGKRNVPGKKQMPGIDMTPMVDLGFLLITFFVFTTSLSTPKATDLFMPKDGPVTIPPNLPESLALTFMLGENDRIFYYHGEFEKAKSAGKIFETGYSVLKGMGNVIRQKQKDIISIGKYADGSSGLMLLIKPMPFATYKNTVDALDETMINGVKKYMIVEPLPEEIALVQQRSGV